MISPGEGTHRILRGRAGPVSPFTERMTTDNHILRHLLESDSTPGTADELAQRLEVPTRKRKAFREEVDAMEKGGQVVRVKRDRYCLPRDADLVTGTIQFRQSGRAMVRPFTNTYQASAEPVEIRAADTGVALHGDRVVARLQRERPVTRGRPGKSRGRAKGKGKPTPPPTAEASNGRVIRILERARDSIPGTLKKARHAWYVIPDEPRIVHDILVPQPGKDGQPKARVGDKVVVRLLEWTQRHMNPEGEITEVLGRTHEPMAEYRAILHKYNLDPDFPEEVLKQVRNVPSEVSARQREGRLDCRDRFTLTIDPEDAKDFDDALSLEKAENGNWQVGVHIADVHAYVKPGSPLDQEAARRANSTYLTGTVIPMLPPALSNGICSLVEGEDRLTKSVFLEFTAKGRLVRHSFANTVIRSNKRLTYQQALAFLEKDDFAEIRATPLPPAHQTGSTGRPLGEVGNREMRELQRTIRKLWVFASRQRRNRMSEGSLDLDMPEVKIFVDEKGRADRMESVEQDESHQLIEEFMLAANEAVAHEIQKLKLPCLFRVHDEPDAEKLEDFREYLATVGITVGDLTLRREIARMLRQVNNHPQAYTLRIQFLRSLRQACYRASPDGHYGLNKSDYTHFTSPIRRYADLVVHRVFENLLLKKGVPSAPDQLAITYSPARLESLGEHLSVMERNSVDAERESVKIKLLEYFEDALARPAPRPTYEAIITDVKNHGLFIELAQSLAFGLVHVSTLRDDLYQLSADGMSLVGRKTGREYTLGQSVQVTVERVDRFKRQIDFAIVS